MPAAVTPLMTCAPPTPTPGAKTTPNGPKAPLKKTAGTKSSSKPAKNSSTDKVMETTGLHGEPLYPDSAIPQVLKFKLSRKMNVPNAPLELIQFYPGAYAEKFPLLPKATHPTLFFERFFLAQEIMLFAHKAKCRSVLDVGGNVVRESRTIDTINRALKDPDKMSYFSCNPQLSAADTFRCREIQEHIEDLNPNHYLHSNYKEERLQDCAFKREVDALIFIHSGYYFSPLELLQQIMQTKKQTAWMVKHDFSDDPEGTFNDAVWKRDGTDIIMKVDGNTHSYRRSAMD